MVSVIFAVLEVSFGTLTTVVKLPWKFLPCDGMDSAAIAVRVGDGSVGHGLMGHMGRHYSMGHMSHGSLGADP